MRDGVGYGKGRGQPTPPPPLPPRFTEATIQSMSSGDVRGLSPVLSALTPAQAGWLIKYKSGDLTTEQRAHPTLRAAADSRAKKFWNACGRGDEKTVEASTRPVCSCPRTQPDVAHSPVQELLREGYSDFEWVDYSTPTFTRRDLRRQSTVSCEVVRDSVSSPHQGATSTCNPFRCPGSPRSRHVRSRGDREVAHQERCEHLRRRWAQWLHAVDGSDRRAPVGGRVHPPRGIVVTGGSTLEPGPGPGPGPDPDPDPDLEPGPGPGPEPDPNPDLFTAGWRWAHTRHSEPRARCDAGRIL